MRRFQFNKLVRDKVIELTQAASDTPHYRTLNDQEFLQELKTKLLEEAREAIAETDPQKLAEELADVQEILDHLYQLLSLTPEEIKQLQAQKNTNRGSFHHRHYIEYTDVQPGTKWESYFRKQPDKYPELETEK